MKDKECNTNEPLFSKCIKAGQRYYYIDAKKDCNGVSYIVLTESKNVDDSGNKKRHRIFLYQEDMDKFAEAFNEVLQYVKENQEIQNDMQQVALDNTQDATITESDVNLWEDEEIKVDWQKKWED